MPLTNNLVHALRLWGPRAEFGEAAPSGATMLRYLLDDTTFRSLAGPQASPLWSRSPHGIRPRNFEDDAAHALTSSYHVDDLLATLAESGVSLEETVLLRDGSTGTVRQMLDHALATFYLKRFEYEWTMIAYIRYAWPHPYFTNQFGERLDAAALVHELIDHPHELGPCNGLHRLEAMVLLDRADEPFGTLPPAVKARMRAYMLRVSQLLQRSQQSDGSWSRSWSSGQVPAAGTPIPVNERLLVTGHQLEWLALAPEEVLPPRSTIVQACQYLARTMAELEPRHVEEFYGPLSHAARALCLWRGREPLEAWSEFRQSTP
jgi:hypothetical protein